MKAVVVSGLGWLVVLAVLILLMLCGGCSSWSFTKESVHADGSSEKITAKQEQVLTQREIADMEILIDNAALMTVGSGKMDSHEATLLVEKLTPAVVEAVRAAFMGGLVP